METTVADLGYSITQADVENVFTLLSGLVSVNVFMLLAQLMTLGALLVVVFVIALRKF